MGDHLEVKVLVPADRVSEFQRALGAFAAGQPMPPATPGSSASDWKEMTVPVQDSAVPAFLAAVGTWLGQAAGPAPAPASPPDLDQPGLAAIWPALPEGERELLRLLSDDYGRPVAWTEVKRKLLLAGKPSLPRDFPVLTAACAGPPAVRFPVRQDGKDDDAVFSLPPALVDAVRAVSTA